MSRLCRVLGFVLALSLVLSFWSCDDETILEPEDLNPPLNAGAGKRPGPVGVDGRAQIQDLGFVVHWGAADIAPEDGCPDADFSVTALENHVYAVRTGFVTPN